MGFLLVGQSFSHSSPDTDLGFFILDTTIVLSKRSAENECNCPIHTMVWNLFNAKCCAMHNLLSLVKPYCSVFPKNPCIENQLKMPHCIDISGPSTNWLSSNQYHWLGTVVHSVKMWLCMLAAIDWLGPNFCWKNPFTNQFINSKKGAIMVWNNGDIWTDVFMAIKADQLKHQMVVIKNASKEIKNP